METWGHHTRAQRLRTWCKLPTAAQAEQREQHAPCADLCAAGHSYRVTASWSRGLQAPDLGNCCAPSVAGRPEDPSSSSQERAHGVQGPSPRASRCTQIPLTGTPSSQSPNPHARSPPRSTQGSCAQSIPRPPTLSHGGTTCPQPEESVKRGRPGLGSEPRGRGSEGRSCPGGAAEQRARCQRRCRRGRHLLSAGPRCPVRGRAGPGSSLLTFPADHRSAVADGRSAPYQPESGRAAAPRPAPPRPNRPGAASRHRLRERPATTAATAGLWEARPAPRSRARLGLPSPGAVRAPLPAPSRRRRARSALRAGTVRAAAAPSPGRQRRRQGEGSKGGRRRARRTPAGSVCRSSALLT